jgi:putative transposase
MACKVMQVSTSAYYVWLKNPGELITADTLALFRRAKALFKASRNSLGSRELDKALLKEGFSITRYRTIKLMARLKLHVTVTVLKSVPLLMYWRSKPLKFSYSPRSQDEYGFAK